jgi:hypothetical protein
MFLSGERTHQSPLLYSHSPLRGLKAAWGTRVGGVPGGSCSMWPNFYIPTEARLRGDGSSNYWLRVQFRVSGKMRAGKMQDRGNDRGTLN